MGGGLAESADQPANQRLVFHDQLAHVDRDPQSLAYRLAQHYSLKDFGPLPGTEKQFLHRTSTCQAGDLLLSGGYSSPLLGTIGEREGVGSVNLIFSGEVCYGSGGQDMLVNQQRPFFFSPGAEYTYKIDDHFNGVVFHIDLQRLRRTAAAIAGLGISERRFAGALDQVRTLSISNSRSAQLLKVLSHTFSLLDHPELEMLGHLQHLQIDDLIYRNLALLLCPQLEAISQHDSIQRGQRERIFEDLLEWARENLDQPINLTQLEQRSGYSRRSLQLVFQQRFGCGPIQWIRRQRLEQARQALLYPKPDDTVGSIAARYGFSSLSVFSRDFSSHFGLRPSDLLREGRTPKVS
jgi:AraC-like DNA-binding protein